MAELLPRIKQKDYESYVWNNAHLDQIVKINNQEYKIERFLPNYVLCSRAWIKNTVVYECFTYSEIWKSIGGRFYS